MDNLEFYPDPNSKLPLYKQLYNHIKDGIISGKITGGERLPSRRKLAQKLNISTNTVLGAYQLLESEGYIVPKASSGFYVNPDYNLFKTPFISIGRRRAMQNIYSAKTVLNSPKFRKKSLARDLPQRHIRPAGLIFSRRKARRPMFKTSGFAKYLYAVRGIKCDENQIIIGAELITFLHVFAAFSKRYNLGIGKSVLPPLFQQHSRQRFRNKIIKYRF